MPNQKYATTTVSHLHDGTVSQFSKNITSYFKIRMAKSQKIHPSYHRHKIKPLCWYYTPHEVSEKFVQLLVDRVDVAHTLFKIWFSFFFVIATHLTAILLPESLHDKNINAIVGFWFNVPLQ